MNQYECGSGLIWNREYRSAEPGVESHILLCEWIVTHVESCMLYELIFQAACMSEVGRYAR